MTLLQVLVGLLPRYPDEAMGVLDAFAPLLMGNSAELQQFVSSGCTLQMCSLLAQDQLNEEASLRACELLCLMCERLHARGTSGALFMLRHAYWQRREGQSTGRLCHDQRQSQCAQD